MFAAATSFFSRTNISTNYNVGSQSSSSSLPGFGSGSRASTPGPSGSPSSSSVAAAAAAGGSAGSGALPLPQLTPTFHVGLWRVQPATHKVTGKRVSVWTFEKRELERVGGSGKERVIEALKNEVRVLYLEAMGSDMI